MAEQLYFVSWIPPKKAVMDENGDCDLDSTEDERRCRKFKLDEFDKAIEFARTVDDFFGDPHVSLRGLQAEDEYGPLPDGPFWGEVEEIFVYDCETCDGAGFVLVDNEYITDRGTKWQRKWVETGLKYECPECDGKKYTVVRESVGSGW